MNLPPTDSVTAGAQENIITAAPEPAPSLAPPSSTSVLSDAPTTDPSDLADHEDKHAFAAETADTPNETAPEPTTPGPLDQPKQDSATKTTQDNPPGWDAAKDEAMNDVPDSETMPAPTCPADGSAKRGGRGGKRTSLPNASATPGGADADGAQSTPISSGRGRGRGGRPRGRGRGGGRGGKRKREDGSDGSSSDSEVATPAVTMTKSGRNVQKPTSFVPPPPSPTTTTSKRKRAYRRNPESAVCKMCLRGTSPASNMIVFCDGCNTPYHRYCHQPPIDQAVIDEVDKEWYCKPCENERIVPVPEAEVAGFVSASAAPLEQRQKYFASLPPGLLVTLLTKATTLRPDLPLFGPDFEARASTTHGPAARQPNFPQPPPPTQLPPQPYTTSMFPPPPPQQPLQPTLYAEDPRYPVPDEHPAHYVRPGQGLMRSLPPEQNDVHYLVDDDRHRVFSHYHLDPTQQGMDMGQGGMMGRAGPGA